MNFSPHIEGTLSIKAPNEQFAAALEKRVNDGLLAGKPGPRSNYEVVESTGKSIRVRAVGWWTAINVGLNDFRLDLTQTGKLHFRLQYWRWAIYCIGVCFVIGLTGILFFWAIDLRAYMAQNPGARVAGLTIEQNLMIGWGNLLFWGFAWPWILIAMHKRPLRRLLERLVAEIDESALK